MTKKIETRHIGMNMPAKLLEEIKEACDKNHCTMTAYIIRSVLDQLHRDKQYE